MVGALKRGDGGRLDQSNPISRLDSKQQAQFDSTWARVLCVSLLNQHVCSRPYQYQVVGWFSLFFLSSLFFSPRVGHLFFASFFAFCCFASAWLLGAQRVGASRRSQYTVRQAQKQGKRKGIGGRDEEGKEEGKVDVTHDVNRLDCEVTRDSQIKGP